ncbi:MAG: glycosyltransferase family 87 protein, partial [Afipia sp.]|nr:glycosyltransferase family 87 protein [Afipia sp.]
SFVPFALVMRGLVGRPFGWLLAAAFPVVLVNTLIGQNGFLTAALVGGTLYLLPIRPVLSGICLGLLSYKPQYGLLFPLVLVVARQWAVFVTAGAVAALMSIASLAVFGTEAWLAWWNWLPMASQAFLSEGRAPWGKMQSIFATVRFFDGTEHFAWICQWTMTALVACALVALWRSRVRYSIKAAGLATGTLLATPYLFLYDVMVLAIPVALMIRVGLKSGFRNYELPALGIILALLFIYPVVGAPTGFAATLIMAAMVAGRAGLFGVVETNEQAAPQKLPQLQT